MTTYKKERHSINDRTAILVLKKYIFPNFFCRIQRMHQKENARRYNKINLRAVFLLLLMNIKQNEINKGCNKNQAVKAVKHATVTGKNITIVFYVKFPFYSR